MLLLFLSIKMSKLKNLPETGSFLSAVRHADMRMGPADDFLASLSSYLQDHLQHDQQRPKPQHCVSCHYHKLLFLLRFPLRVCLNRLWTLEHLRFDCAGQRRGCFVFTDEKKFWNICLRSTLLYRNKRAQMDLRRRGRTTGGIYWVMEESLQRGWKKLSEPAVTYSITAGFDGRTNLGEVTASRPS